MRKILDKFLLQSKNSNKIESSFKYLEKNTEVAKIFQAIETYSKNSELRYVGGCVRKILCKEKIDDIDLATNLEPSDVSAALKSKNIKFYETGIKHGTITAVINKKKFEITSLRKDVSTDGRHAEVKYSKDWQEDASRRDFTINSIYSNMFGDLYDPFNGKKDLSNGIIRFIGEPEKRIKEDYLRILRYVRFFLCYSKIKHNDNVISIIKKNIDGVYKISTERQLDEFKKLTKTEGFLNLPKDKALCEIIQLIFPQFKKINILKNQRNFIENNLEKIDFIIWISLLTIDGTDNVEYFLYKFNLSNKDKKRILFLNNFFSKKISNKDFSLQNLQKIFYFEGKQTLNDVLFFQAMRSKKIDKKILNFIDFFKNKEPPLLPLRAITLMTKYNIPEGKELGIKLKKIEEKWVDNNFKISEQEVQDLISS